MGSNGGVIDGVRFHNIHEDSIGITHGKGSAIGSKGVTIKNTWISYNKGNAIEDDHVPPTLIDDVLIDGSWVPISVDPGARYHGDCEESNNTITISNALIKTMKGHDNSNSRIDYQPWIATHAVSETCKVLPKFEIYNSVFAFEGWPELIPV